MARVREIPLGRSHQLAAYKFARKQLSKRLGEGIVLADGVGLGKTYEALSTVATYLSQTQHRRERKRRMAFRVLILVPPGLVSKWADELLLPDRFPQYMERWRSGVQRAVASTFLEQVVVLRRKRDLENTRGEQRYGRIELPPGLYVVNHNLLYKEGKRVTQIHKTRWDAIIVDEAHHLGSDLIDRPPHSLLSRPTTATILLTATPFQLSPKDMKGLLASTFGGYGHPKFLDESHSKAQDLYYSNAFGQYRALINEYFTVNDVNAAKAAARLRKQVRAELLPRIIRNRKKENRQYHLVNAEGVSQPFETNPFALSVAKLTSLLSGPDVIQMDREAKEAYLHSRDQICDAVSSGRSTFVSGTLRQFLSSWPQFRKSTFGRLGRVVTPRCEHPKLAAASRLIDRLARLECTSAMSAGWFGKSLIFTTYVGADSKNTPSTDPREYGTAAALKKSLEDRLNVLLPRSSKKKRLGIFSVLDNAIKAAAKGLSTDEKASLRRKLRVFSGSGPASFLLSNPDHLRGEQRILRKMLRAIESEESIAQSVPDGAEEARRRLEERRKRRLSQILDRYSTRDLVARYDGAMTPEDRDRHLQGFNSPYAPLVLIASSVGQEGIDLQRYCRHVIHYDLEWNPAKLEQREGRVDRAGRLALDPVNVYFLICQGTYDERILHCMANRFRWHHVLLANRSALESNPTDGDETYIAPEVVRKMSLDLRPPSR